MRIQYLATLVAWLFLSGTAFAGDLKVIRTDSSSWPVARVVVATQEAGASAREYALTPPSGKAVTAKRITELLDEPRPASMIVALDTSRSLSPKHLDAAKSSLVRYVDRLNGNEQISLLAFNDAVELVTGFTADREAFKSTLSRLQLGGQQTELYRAMLYGIENLKNIPGQRTLLVITDGKDEGSVVTLDQVIRAARETGVRILAIGLPVLPGKESETYLPRMEQLAKQTGGAYQAAATTEQLGEATYALMVENQGLATHVYELEFDMSGTGMRADGKTEVRLSHKAGDAVAVSFSGSQPAASAPQRTAAPAVAQPLARPAPEKAKGFSIWPWLLALLALLLILFFFMRRRAFSPASIAAGEQAPLLIEFPDRGLRFPLRPGTMVMGSGPASDIRLDDPNFADAHVEFCTGADCSLRPLAGSYGVQLNGKEVTQSTVLKPGDTLTFGTTKAVIKRVDA